MKKFVQEIREQYGGFFDGIKLYWSSYGSWRSFLASPYLHISILITIIGAPVILCPEIKLAWYTFPLSILPNLLGFTLGGYAILLAFGDEKFRRVISEYQEDGTSTFFMSLNGAFIHFILLQAISILVAVIGNIWEIKLGWYAWLGFGLFVYSILSAVAAAMAILDTADLFQSWKNHEHSKEKSEDSHTAGGDSQ